MRYQPTHFSLDEIVCEDIYNKFGAVAWQFFDPRLLITLDTIRDRIGKPIYINNWQIHGQFDERGFRCQFCPLVKDAVKQGRLYVSPHMTGQAADFDVEGLTAEEVRQWLVTHEALLPYPIRLERGVNWVHCDTRDANMGKVFLFNP